MPSLNRVSWPAMTLLALVPGLASTATAISQSTISAPGGFAQAGTYSSTCGCSMAPGDNLAVHLGTAQDFHEMSFAGSGAAQASATYSGGSISNSAQATAGLGVFRPSAHNSAPPPSFFPQGTANGGWKESLTISNPSLTGQGGYLVFQVRARGSLHATSWAGSARLTFLAYKDHSGLAPNPYYNQGNSEGVGEQQGGSWSASSEGPSGVADKSVDGIVTMAAPITFGQPFTLGIYGLAVAGMRSSGGFPGISTADCDFSGEGITWNGVVNILNGAGAPVGGSTITSGSGINWTGPYTPPIVGVERLDAQSSLTIRTTSANPSAGMVRLALFLPHAANARVGIFDVAGRRVRGLANGWGLSGSSELVWDGRTEEGTRAGAGLYFVRAEWEDRVATQRLVRLR